jgi:hypothetical protein
MRLMVATSVGKDGTVGLYYPVTAEDGSYHVSSIPPGIYLINVLSTNTGGGVRIKAGEVATLDLTVASLPPPQGGAQEVAPPK